MGTPEISFKKFSKEEWLDFIQNTLKQASLEDYKWKISEELEGLAFAHSDDIDSLLKPMSEGLAQHFPLLCWSFQTKLSAHKQLIEHFDAVSLDMEMLSDQSINIPPDQLLLINTKASFNWEYIEQPHLLHLPNTLNSDIKLFIENIKNNPNCQGIVIDIPPGQGKSSVVATMAEFWIEFIRWIKAISGDLSLLRILFEKLHFQTRLSSDFLYEIAFIRAIKLLYYNVQQSLGVEISPCNLIVDLEPPNLPESISDRLILSTVQSMAASIGGVKMLLIKIDPIEDKAVEQIRWLRNIQLIMKNESNMNQVFDPVAGSYVIENLSVILANSIWSAIPAEL